MSEAAIKISLVIAGPGIEQGAERENSTSGKVAIAEPVSDYLQKQQPKHQHQQFHPGIPQIRSRQRQDDLQPQGRPLVLG